jgi:hypothetical protein
MNNDDKIPYLNDFQQELDLYKQLNQMMKLPKHRVGGFQTLLFSQSFTAFYLALFI